MKIAPIFTIFLFFTLASASLAEGESRSEWVLREKAKTSDEEINAGSDASFDKRLPPVLPGEEVNDSGKRIKVWSTTGGVPVSEAPEVSPRKKRHIGDIDVIVDGRKTRAKKERSEGQ